MKKSSDSGSEYNTVTVVSSRELREQTSPFYIVDKDLS